MITKYIFIILLLGLVIRIIILATCNYKITGDAIVYERFGWNISQGRGFSQSISEPYKPAIFRTPGYPLFIAFIYSIFGRNPTWVMFFQLVLDLLTCYIVFLIAEECFNKNKRISIISLLLITFCPFTANYIFRLQSENLTIFLLTLSIFLSIKAILHNKISIYILTGLTLGATTLTRPTTSFLIFLLPILMLIISEKKNNNIRGSLFVVLFSVILISQWSIRNYFVFGKFIPLSAGGVGIGLWTGVWERNDHWMTKDNWNIPPEAYNSEEEKKLVLNLYKRFYDVAFSDGGIEIKNIDDDFKKIAINKIKSNPIQYITLRIKRIPKLWWVQENYSTYTDYIKVIIKSFYLIFAIIGLLRIKNNKLLFIVFLPIIYITVIHFPLHIETRYSIIAFPMLIIFSSHGLGLISNFLIRPH